MSAFLHSTQSSPRGDFAPDPPRQSPFNDAASQRHTLDFDAKRAGRAVVNLHLEYGLYENKIIHYSPIELRVRDLVPACMVVGYGHGGFRTALDDPWDVGSAVLWPSSVPVDTGSVVEAEAPDAEIVQWFVDQVRASDESYEDGATDLDEQEPEDEVILGDAFTTQLWRGGGTMSRR
jgi:hypothetical protein